MKAKWHGEPFRDFSTKKWYITFETEEVPSMFDELKGKVLSVDIKEYSKKKSLSANAYFHVLCGKIADAMTISKAHAKNMLVTKYGQLMYARDDVACIKSNLTIEQVQEMEEPHLKFIQFSEEENAYFYYIYRGVRTYTSQEMSKLIEGTVADAKELGIQTETPEEIERMKQTWGINIQNQ